MPSNERERRMAMLRAALPYTTGSRHHALEMLLQANTLYHIASHPPEENDLEACGMDVRPEEMLMQIQEYCTPREADFIQMILNFRKARHLFQSYREFMSTHNNSSQSNNMMDFLITQLPPEQKQLFEQLQAFSGGDFPMEMFQSGMFPDFSQEENCSPDFCSSEVNN